MDKSDCENEVGVEGGSREEEKSSKTWLISTQLRLAGVIYRCQALDDLPSTNPEGKTGSSLLNPVGLSEGSELDWITDFGGGAGWPQGLESMTREN